MTPPSLDVPEPTLDADPIIEAVLRARTFTFSAVEVALQLVTIYAWERGEPDPLSQTPPPAWWPRLRHERDGDRWAVWLAD